MYYVVISTTRKDKTFYLNSSHAKLDIRRTKALWTTDINKAWKAYNGEAVRSIVRDSRIRGEVIRFEEGDQYEAV